MSTGWENLPLLPLKCILDHLSVDNALAAMSTCRHWRTALLLYEGQVETLKLNAKQLEKNLFLTRLFRKNAEKLHVYIDCSEDDLNKFMNFVLPQFFDSLKLKEVVFIGPIYMLHDPLTPYAKLKRIITESLVFKHSEFLQKLAILGCEMAAVKNENDRYVHKRVEYYSKPLCFNCVTSPADAVLSGCNVDIMSFSSLNHIMFEYDLITTESLKTLSRLNNLTLLTLNIIFKKDMQLNPVDWGRVTTCFDKGLDVAVNIISVPSRKFKSIVDNILVEGMPLTSLKVMFCKTLYTPLISHLCREFSSTLRELVWVDSPHEGGQASRYIRLRPDEVYLTETYNQVNPFILLCWQCTDLRRLVIHGYWVWQYDLVGFIRLRKTVRVELSSVFGRVERFNSRPSQIVGVTLRVLTTDSPAMLDAKYTHEINQYAGFQWKPIPWCKLHPGLRTNASMEERTDYIIEEVLQPLGVT